MRRRPCRDDCDQRRASYPRFRAFALLLATLATQAWGEPRKATTLPLLTTVRQAHSLTQEQASLGYPVRLRAVVTNYDPHIDSRHGSLFVQDETGGIFVATARNSVLPIRPGTEVEVSGVTAPGDFAPIVVHPEIHVIRRSRPLPRPPSRTVARLATGSDDACWVEVEGLVHSMESYAREVVLTLATIDGPITATMIREPGAEYTNLIDAKVLVRGVAGALYNNNRQMTGVRLLVAGLKDIVVEEAAPNDPFELPLRSVGSLLQYSPGIGLQHRVRVRGRVTLHWPGRLLCVQEGNKGLCVQTLDRTILREGELVDVAGFPSLENYQPTLSNATLRRVGSGRAVAVRRITAEGAFTGEHNAELVEIEGKVIGRGLIAQDSALLVSSQGVVFPAIVAAGSGTTIGGKQGERWSRNLEGATVRMRGIFLGKVDARQTNQRTGVSRLESFQIVLRSPADVTVVEPPSWWTSQHTLMILSIVFLSTVAALAWSIVLHRRVQQQTHLARASEERFRYLAEHDSLTGLTSRAVLYERLNQALETARRKQTPLALLMMDVDKFKQVNDSLGHAAGDEILCVTAKRIKASVRETDTVARTGGDEFMVLLPGVRGTREASKIAAEVVANVAAPVTFRGHEVPVSVSVGISSYPDGGEDATALLQNVDIAMYEAKSLGRNRYQFFSSEMARGGANKLEFAVALNHALDKQEFEIHYQPLVDIVTGEVSGLEALLRWRNRKLGLVMPSDFIPLAEETGLIAPIGEWVLRESCLEVSRLETKLGRRLLLAVNISPRQMQQGNLLLTIRDALAASNRHAGDLELEITESILISKSTKTRNAFDEIRDLGVRLAIDDFGTGFSSLSYITEFHVDRLKIDRSFIRNCLTDRNSEAVTRVIISMAHGLDISVIAEGVETLEQYRFLEEAQCDAAQGYYFSRPIPAAELERSLLGLPTRVLQI